MDNQLQELLAVTYTKDKLHHSSMLLKEFFAEYFFKEHGDLPIRDMLRKFLVEKKVPTSVSDTLLSLSDNFLHAVTAGNFREILDSLEEAGRNSPHIILYIPTILPPSETERLGEWFRKNIARNLFMDIKVDVNTVGGCAFVWNGVHHDFSLKHYMSKNRSEIKTLLRNYERVSE